MKKSMRPNLTKLMIRGLVDFIIILSLVVLLVYIITGCTSSKHMQTNSTSSEEKKSFNVDSLVNKKLDSARVVYEEKRKETEGEIQFYSDNISNMNDVIADLQGAVYDSTITADSLRKLLYNIKCPDNKFIYHADGSFEVSGQIKSLKGTISELQKKLDSSNTKRDDTTEISKATTDEKKTEKKESRFDKTVKIFRWWLLLLIGYIIGTFLPPMRIIDITKRLITKK